MELPEVPFDELLVSRLYLIVCHRNGSPCDYEVWAGDTIGLNRDRFKGGQDFNHNSLTYKFYLLPKLVR